VTYSVHYAESIFNTQVEPLPPAERAEVDAHIESLATQPLPEQGSNRVIRIRDVSAPIQPFFAARTRHFMIFHTVQEDRVLILGVFPARLRT
jgi:hypothetical protein